jgi:hypothetical protein
MATLGLKERENSFKLKVAIAEFFWKMQRKTWYVHIPFLGWMPRHASFPQKSVVKVMPNF